MPTAFQALLKDDGSGGVGGLTGEHELCALFYDPSDEPTEVIVLVKNEGDNKLSTEQTVGASKSSSDLSLTDDKSPIDVPNGSSQPMMEKSSSPSKKMPVLGVKGKPLSGNNSKVTSNENASPQKGTNAGSLAALGSTKAALFESGGESDGQCETMSLELAKTVAAFPATTTKRARSSIENNNGPVMKRSKKKECSCEECPNKAISGGVCMGHGADNLVLTRKQSRSEGSKFDHKENEQISTAIGAVEMNRNKKPAAGKVTLPRGVTVRPSGKWQAQIYYAGKSRYIGVFESREDACYAYEVAGQVLMTSNEQNDDKVDANINLAKRAAFAGVEKRCRGAIPLSPVSRARALIVAENDATHLHAEEVRKKQDEEERQHQKRSQKEKGPVKQRSKKKYCSWEGCKNGPFKGGVCWRHGAKNTGKKCSNEGCSNYALNGGVCVRHGAKVKRCSWLGCTNNAVKGGVCIRHGATKSKKKCSREGCSNQSQKGGVCRRHGAKDLMKKA